MMWHFVFRKVEAFTLRTEHIFSVVAALQTVNSVQLSSWIKGKHDMLKAY